MSQRSLICGAIWVLSLIATLQAGAQETATPSVNDSRNTEIALEILARSTRFIEAAPAFSISGDAGGELLMKNGQLVEYGSHFKTLFVRPSKLFFQLDARDGSKTTMILDGETITVASYADGKHIYDTTPQRGDVNESLDFVTSHLGSAREMADFLTEQLTQSLSQVQSGLSLGKSTIDGIECDHLALRSNTRDGQVWIARGDEPAPRRMVITHRVAPEKPRFWAQFKEWDFSPQISDTAFSYEPPEGAVRVQIFAE